MSKDIQLYQVSENDLEKCLKCSICNAYCPVSGVTLKFPGPKWAGPDGERHRLKDETCFDEKTMKMCLNCKRCEIVCPQGVKVGDIIQSARIKYSLQGIGIREFMLANTDLVGTLATHSFGLANRVVNMGLTKWMLHKMVGIHQGRTFPAYASHTFEAWYRREAAKGQQGFDRKVAYFHGCYVNYNYPKLGQDFVKIMNACGYGVHLLEKEKCCGVALIANGLSGQAKRQGENNIQAMRRSLSEGNEAVLTTSSTCTFTMRDEYPDLLKVDNQGVRDSLMLATRFLCQKIDEGKIKLVFRKDYHKKVAYHTACHMERMGWTLYSTQLLKMIPGLDFMMLDSHCCGIAGTYGFKKENYERSQKIGAPLFQQIKEVNPDYVSTDCETCKWQIEMSTGYPVMNPISILADALDVEATKALNQNR